MFCFFDIAPSKDAIGTGAQSSSPLFSETSSLDTHEPENGIPV